MPTLLTVLANVNDTNHRRNGNPKHTTNLPLIQHWEIALKRGPFNIQAHPINVGTPRYPPTSDIVDRITTIPNNTRHHRTKLERTQKHSVKQTHTYVTSAIKPNHLTPKTERNPIGRCKPDHAVMDLRRLIRNHLKHIFRRLFLNIPPPYTLHFKSAHNQNR